MLGSSSANLWPTAGYYINICLGYVPSYLRFCSYAHLCHLGYTIDSLYACPEIVPVFGEEPSSYDPLILSMDIFYSVASDGEIAGGTSVDRNLLLRILETVADLQKRERLQFVPIAMVLGRLKTHHQVSDDGVLEHTRVLVRHGWIRMRQNTRASGVDSFHVALSIPGHREITACFQEAEAAVWSYLLHSPVPLCTISTPVRHAPTVREYALSQDRGFVVPTNFHFVYGAEYHVAALLGKRSFTICSTERCTYIGLGDVFSEEAQTLNVD